MANLNLKSLAESQEVLTGGHRLCAGCGASIVIRQIMAASPEPVVVSCATGCLEVATTIYPFTAWKSPFIHSAFENSAATISGAEAAYRSLKRQGKLDKEMKFIGLGGDGGTYDIGLQALSGAMERRHNMVYVCYNNEGYMNTGIQRSSATPRGASTSTSPAGRVIPGKPMVRKDLTGIIAAHNVAYAAQAAAHNWRDLTRKARRAFEVDGPAFLNVLAPCPRGWRYPMEDTVQMCRLAADTCFWPLYEVDDGQWKVNYKPKEKKPLTDFLKPQGRFRHLFRPGNEHILEEMQAEIDRSWERLLSMEECVSSG